MSQLPSEKVPNSQRIQVLQGEVASLRGQAPAIVCNLMEKERQLLANNLKNSEFRTDNGSTVNVKEINKMYIKNSLMEVQKPMNHQDSQIDLNATTDNLLKCIEYLRK